MHVEASRAWSAADATAAQHEGDFTLTGLGGSMEPVYQPGTIVVVHPTSYFMLRVGMPVVYVNRRGHQVAHVLVAELANGWVVQGLNNPEADDELVTGQNLVGLIRCAFIPDTNPAPAQPGRTLALDTPPHRPLALLH